MLEALKGMQNHFPAKTYQDMNATRSLADKKKIVTVNLSLEQCHASQPPAKAMKSDDIKCVPESPAA